MQLAMPLPVLTLCYIRLIYNVIHSMFNLEYAMFAVYMCMVCNRDYKKHLELGKPTQTRTHEYCTLNAVLHCVRPCPITCNGAWSDTMQYSIQSAVFMCSCLRRLAQL